MEPRTRPGPEAPVRRKLTVEEFESLPFEEEEGVFIELLDGEIVVTRGAPRLEHQQISGRLMFLIMSHLRGTKAEVYHQPTGTVLGRYSSLLPDLLVLLEERLALRRKDGIYGAPDLVVEILSPGSRERDRGKKRRVYAAQGVREYWIVDPDERVLEQHVLAGRGFRLAGRHRGAARFRAHVLPDLEVPLGEVWPEPLGR